MKDNNLQSKENKKKILNIQNMTMIGMMTALICVMAPFSLHIPISPVPISLTNLALYFILYVLGMKRTLLCNGLYLLIGLVGIPVFSNFTSGPGKLLGPTGGYLIGFLFMTLIAGLFVDKWEDKIWVCVIGMIVGTAVCYLFGTAWLAVQQKMTFSAALMAGVVPFLPGDAVKIIVASLIGPNVKKLVKKAGYL